jgi:hypothetical protein
VVPLERFEVLEAAAATAAARLGARFGTLGGMFSTQNNKLSKR